ncbi:Cell wall synthesis protein [Yarrowia sp. C11]|nr:Cell wall synthesis protein [Yarrowia sp. C11]KAG5364385.1 Cell wall synthesis protein [Yarrowia sp. E02]
MLHLLPQLLVLWLATFVVGDISITAPKLGESFKAGDTIKVTWKDDGETPSLDDFKSLTATLVTGPDPANLLPQGLKLKDGVTVDGGTVSVTVPASAGANGYYTIQLYAIMANGGYAIHYTNWFEMSGLTGSTKAPKSDPGTPPEKQISDKSEKAQGDLLASHTVPYAEQSGTVKYAPMQMQPGSSITAKTMSQRFPTSAFTPFQSFASAPKCTSTDTPGWSYSRGSATNMAPPAPYPSALGWYAASAKTRATPSPMPTVEHNSDQANTQHKKRWFDTDEWLAPKTKSS